jgi:hypothetical protein
MILVIFYRVCVDVTELTRNCDPVLRQPDPGRGKELYAAGQYLPLLWAVGKHLEEALIGTPAFSEAFFQLDGHLDGSSCGLAIFEGLVLLSSEELRETQACR